MCQDQPSAKPHWAALVQVTAHVFPAPTFFKPTNFLAAFAMERYVVRVIGAGAHDEEQLLIPFDRDQLVSAFAAEVRRRHAKRSASSLDCTLRLNSIHGPILDEDDALKHVIVDAAKDVVFVAYGSASTAPRDEARDGKVSPRLW